MQTKIGKYYMFLYQSFLGGKKVIFVLLCCILLASACISPYEAEINESVTLITIEGRIVKGEEIQTVRVSMTSPLDNPEFEQLKECKVVVIDEFDNEFEYTENENGTYSVNIPEDQLVYNRTYSLHVTTPDGNMYASDFEELKNGANVDTVYYKVENRIDNISGEDLSGVQFYIDLKASDTLSRYYRWKLYETYEYTSTSPITYYLTGRPDPPEIYPDDQLVFYRCWKTLPVKKLFSSNTVNLLVNEKKHIPLNFVSSQSDRLSIKYSLLVEQYTLSEGAYSYWHKNKIETQESGGIYTQQPGKPITNMYNVNDPFEQVLGYFWVSDKTEKRIFVPHPPTLIVTGEKCHLVEFDEARHSFGPYPRYIYIDNMRGPLTADGLCFNCLYKGGSTIPPDFWR